MERLRTQRLFITEPLIAGGLVNVERQQANYLLNVLRLKDGAPIYVFNGTDGEWLAHLKPQSRKVCQLIVEKQVQSQTAPSNLTYLFAPLKQARLDYMVQKATEMGAGSLQPVLTQHTQVTRLNIERMRANAIEAAEQCGILSIPDCHMPVKLEPLISGWDTSRPIMFCDENAGDENLATVLGKFENLTPGVVPAVLIGPEGGFSENERQLLNSKPFVTAISLGPRILRADTAAVAALAIAQAHCGDW